MAHGSTELVDVGRIVVGEYDVSVTDAGPGPAAGLAAFPNEPN